MNRQRLILFVLVILFSLAVIWSYRSIPRPKTVAVLKNAPGQQAKTISSSKNQTPVAVSDNRFLRLEQLEKEHPGFKGYVRNIFKPVFVDESKITKQKAAAVKAPPPSLPPLPPPPQNAAAAGADSAAAKPVAAPLARFTFLGFLKKDSQRTIFLAKDKDIILVKKGDKIAGRYEAFSITDQALTLLVTDTGDEIVIPLIENKSLGASK